ATDVGRPCRQSRGRRRRAYSHGVFHRLAALSGAVDDAHSLHRQQSLLCPAHALLGHWNAVAMNGLMSVQTVVAIMLVRQPRLRWAYYALMPLSALASVAAM